LIAGREIRRSTRGGFSRTKIIVNSTPPEVPRATLTDWIRLTEVCKFHWIASPPDEVPLGGLVSAIIRVWKDTLAGLDEKGLELVSLLNGCPSSGSVPTSHGGRAHVRKTAHCQPARAAMARKPVAHDAAAYARSSAR
jgi:hypothetical protein